MKPEIYYINNLDILQNAISRIKYIIPNGKFKVTISDAGSKSVRQRGLQWIWYDDVVKAGIGGQYEDTKEGVHLLSKYRWYLPILQRDSEDFAALYELWYEKYGKDKERMLWFVDTQVSTEDLDVSQMAEYLTSFQQHYSRHGVTLTDPAFRGLLD